MENLDFYKWCLDQSDLIENKRFNEIDWDQLKQELLEMGRREKRELLNRLIILLAHLIKMKTQKDYDGQKSCISTIKEQRFQIEELMIDNPSLKYVIDELYLRAIPRAIELAEEETQLKISEDILDGIDVKKVIKKSWWPNGA